MPQPCIKIITKSSSFSSHSDTHIRCTECRFFIYVTTANSNYDYFYALLVSAPGIEVIFSCVSSDCELGIPRISESNRSHIGRKGCWERDYIQTTEFPPLCNLVSVI